MSLPAFAEPPSPQELAAFPANDLGNALRLIRLSGGVIGLDGEVDSRASQLLYLRHRGWIAFNGKFWDLACGEDLARRWAHRVAAGLIAQGEYFGGSSKTWQDFVLRSGSSGSTSSMLSQAAGYLTVDLDAFDPDPLAINVLNGTLQLFKDAAGIGRSRFRPSHDPADRITRICKVAFDPAAAAPAFAALVAFAQPNSDHAAYLQALFGYVATGSNKEQLFIVLQGRGGDGKSTFVNAIRDVVGTYACVAGVETFLDSGLARGGDASPDIARLAGDTRLISTAEPPPGAKLAAAKIKTFTGGGSVVARELRQGIFEFSPHGKVVLECNAKPVIKDTDDGIWRRIRLVLFRQQVAPEAMDRDLPDKLRAEGPGILNWLLAGACAWLSGEMTEPVEMAAALADYRQTSDHFGQWMEERLILESGARTASKLLWSDYKAWCEETGQDRPMTNTAFGSALSNKQLGVFKSGIKYRMGVKLRSTESNSAETEPSQPEPAPIAPERDYSDEW